MQYDPVKRSLGNVFNKTPFLRKLFYRLLDLLLLRAWYIKREVKSMYKDNLFLDYQILVAGSDYGQYCYFLSRFLKKSKILGLDLKEEQIEDCNNFFKQINLSDRVHFEYADLTKYCKENTYDLTLSVDVMEHIEEDEKVFENICKSLKKEGILLISTPSDLGGSDTDHEDGHSFIDEHVRDGYNIENIKNKLKKAGFSTVEAKYSYCKPGSIAWRISMKWQIKMVNLSKLFFILLIPYYIIMYPIAFILDWIDTITTHKRGIGLIVKATK